MAPISYSGYRFPRDVIQRAIWMYVRRGGSGCLQVLCPMQRGALGARALNADLQKALNPNPPSRVERFGSVLA